DATEGQRADGHCCKDPADFYNHGNAVKLRCTTRAGVLGPIIADNYFGSRKKEVKTQISMAANLFGLCEEEHAGGALAFTRYNYGEDVDATRPAARIANSRHT